MKSKPYKNLKAEMIRNEVSIKELAERLRVNRDTMSRKIAGRSPLYLDEAFKISREFFPDVDVHYLFSIDNDPTKAV